MKVLNMKLCNFRGVSEKEITFSDNMQIVGENGSCKTTIMAAYFWALSDMDVDLTANPNVRPEGADDGITTSVEVTLDFDGKEVLFSKIQKVKTKEGTDGKVKTTKTNSFEVNTVPKSQRDAFKYLEDLGFDPEHFLALSHPDMFLKGMTEKKARTAIRDTLFGMVQDIPDMDVAKKAKLKDLTAMLEKYSKDEIVSMQNATKRKITAEYGKSGEVLDNKIDGLNSAKTEIPENAGENLADAENELKELQRQLAEISSAETNNGVMLKIAELEDQKKKYLDKKVCEMVAQHAKVQDEQQKVRGEISLASRELDSLEFKLEKDQHEVDKLEEEIKELQRSYKTAKSGKFDESKTSCPVCKRRFSEKKIEELKANFEEHKAKQLEEITRMGKSLAEQRDELKESVKQTKKDLEANRKKIEKLKKKFTEIPKPVDMPSADDFTRDIDKQVEALKAEMHKDGDTKKKELQAQLEDARAKFAEASSVAANAENNKRIDEKIADLQKKRIEYEQARLDCEKILDQVKTLEMRKNEMLTEQINSNFKLVKWVLFETQANGEILSDRATPYIDGHSMVDAANTGRKILGKLDIVSSLQRFYGQSYPIWLDNAEALTDNTTERIEVESQFIRLIAENGTELTIKA